MNNSTIRSEPLRGGPKTKESAVISRAQLRQQRGAVERWTAWVVLFVSFLGTVVALAGGWESFIASLIVLRPSVAALAGGVGLQALLTYLQWHYYDYRMIAWTARGIDTAFTAVGYGPLVLVPLIAFVATWTTYPLYLAWAIIGIASLVIAWYPESRLVD